VDTLLLDRSTWDLVLDADGNIAKASNPYSLAQDAASVIRTWLGEVYFDTTVGIPWAQQVMGRSPSLSLLREQLKAAALTVPDVATATVYLVTLTDRRVGGQVQVTSSSTGTTSAADFEVINPQGLG
jgi:hypothetical protein